MALQQTLQFQSSTPTQGTLIHGVNVKDNLIREGVDADTLNGPSKEQIIAEARYNV